MVITPPVVVTEAAVVDVPSDIAPDLFASESAQSVKSPLLVLTVGVAATVIELVALIIMLSEVEVTDVDAPSAMSPP